MARALILCNGGVAAGVLTFQCGVGFLLRCPQSAAIGSAGSTPALPGTSRASDAEPRLDLPREGLYRSAQRGAAHLRPR